VFCRVRMNARRWLMCFVGLRYANPTYYYPTSVRLSRSCTVRMSACTSYLSTVPGTAQTEGKRRASAPFLRSARFTFNILAKHTIHPRLPALAR